ncbi:MAG: phosphatase PAP2 family protein [Bacteroidales bacterium]|jgi:undecaprenyl-diphosphatase|nr:phosphatase PAP2 family protein [Bacteroidales bacterium]
MIEFFENIDRQLFLAINGLNSNAADFFFYWVSQKFTWIPFYVLLLFLGIRSLKNKWWLLILFVPLLVTVTDQASVHLFKNVFLRYRPCHNTELKEWVHLVNGYCGGRYGFVSSHAANSFGIAAFMWLIIRQNYHYWFWVLFVAYAGLIGYSRIYLGAHYPSDVFAGAVLGIVSGTFFYYIMQLIFFKKSMKKFERP